MADKPKREPADAPERVDDGRLAIPLDPEQALRALMHTGPHPHDGEGEPSDDPKREDREH